MATSITSEELIPIDCHFKVKAGPGAGKTHWLINHVKNVLATSDRLGKCGKVACITYTNVGVDTISRRLGYNSKSVEVCTIHSFFYNHIVRPYLRFIAAEEGFNLELLNGEDDRFDFSFPTLQFIKKTTGQMYADDLFLKNAIRNARWKLDSQHDVVCVTQYPMKACETRYDKKNKEYKNYLLNSETYIAYKKKAWSHGLMHYDDVLYFAYRLVCRIPFIAKVLACRFPYFFIDEFQDSNPIQVEIVKMIASQGSIIGVIGDPAQSIYGFLGADAKQFDTFSIDGMQEFVIHGNRRSTVKIIDFLNSTRTDLNQINIREDEGVSPSLFVGNHVDNYRKLLEMGIGDVCVLAYDNQNANTLKKMMNVKGVDKYLIDKFEDSNNDRKSKVFMFIKALEHAKVGNFKKSFDFMERMDINVKIAVNIVHTLLAKYDDICVMTLYDFYKYLNETFNLGMATITEGKRIHGLYVSYSYMDFALCVSHEDDYGLQRTIHKAKGDEFSNVLVCIGDEKDLSFITNSNIGNNENHRVYYVAASRAKERLFFSVPTLSDVNKAALENKGIIIV